ncbi:aminoglycoside phosphotransferase family protein [Streptomyces sp. NPDC094032]|uniref:aminoglycoside phosphotransferase family protein n=1 Tax=Streptomyces sp. NPDC094032 TaxID=3155308 RepID=UPI003323A76A
MRDDLDDADDRGDDGDGTRTAAVVVDRGSHPGAVTPWEDASWRAAALGWAERELARHGLRERGPREVRIRPWSVLVRFRVGTGERDAVWFKANPPGSAFEAALGGALADWVPEHVVIPLAVDARRGWSLLPDGGPLLRQALDTGAAGPGAWEEALGQYAAMQRVLTPYAERLTALGVPGAGHADLPSLFDTLVEDNPRLGPDTRRALREGRPRLADWCAELAATGIPDSLDHSDLHEAQLFAPAPGRYTFFDWGDAAVAHPFTSLLVPARAARQRYGPEVLPRLRDAYLDPWTAPGTPLRDLRRAATLAIRLATLSRAVSWQRLFPGTPRDEGDEASAHWVGELFAESTLL